jgi:hypothetical protein
MAFTAKYGGECAYGDYIQPGDLVTYTADDEIAHHECDVLDRRPSAPRSSGICPKCQLTHAGECF